MRLANLDGRLHLEHDGHALALADASGGRLSSAPREVYARWAEVFSVLKGVGPARVVAEGRPYRADELGPPSPEPSQIFAIGLNYVDHAAESGFTRPSAPVVFTKFASCLSGPVSTVSLPDGTVDWEIELVAVIGTGGRGIARADAWNHIAGLTAGQDISERTAQLAGPAPQFSLAKSHAGFAPTGPLLVTPDELAAPDDLELSCWVNDEQVQHARSSEMIFPIPELVEYLSAFVELRPGDLIFTGTPPGVAMGRPSPTYLGRGDRLRSTIEGIGELQQVMG